MGKGEPCPETMDLIAFTQTVEEDALLQYRDTVYVQLDIVDRWLARKAARASRGEAVRRFMMERIRKARRG
jgi:hypothetical protein